MKATVIISVYKDVEALQAVFKSIELQVEKDIEIIVSQDTDDDCFSELIQQYENRFPLQLLQQEDKGFRKNKILNQAILSSRTEKLIFIDGDCVLHPRFVQQHCLYLQPNRFCVGRRVDLDAQTSQLLRSGKITLPTIFMMFKNKTTRIEESCFLPIFLQKKNPRLLGCNMSWYKSDLLRLNGFDETYETPGFGEDTDIEFRAKKAGMKSFSTRFRTIQYHLFHERPSREDQINISKALFQKRKERKDFRCQWGIKTLAI